MNILRKLFGSRKKESPYYQKIRRERLPGPVYSARTIRLTPYARRCLESWEKGYSWGYEPIYTCNQDGVHRA